MTTFSQSSACGYNIYVTGDVTWRLLTAIERKVNCWHLVLDRIHYRLAWVRSSEAVNVDHTEMGGTLNLLIFDPFWFELRFFSSHTLLFSVICTNIKPIDFYVILSGSFLFNILQWYLVLFHLSLVDIISPYPFLCIGSGCVFIDVFSCVMMFDVIKSDVMILLPFYDDSGHNVTSHWSSYPQ